MKLKDERPILYIFIVILIGLNIFLLYNARNTPMIKYMGFKKDIPFFTLCDLEDKKWDSQELLKRRDYTLFIFFSLSDCLPCIRESREWPEINKKENVQVIGISYHVSKRELIDWVRNSGIEFLVLFDKDLKVKETFGISDTPARVFVNQEGKILLKSTHKYPFKRFINDMERIISRNE